MFSPLNSDIIGTTLQCKVSNNKYSAANTVMTITIDSYDEMSKSVALTPFLEIIFLFIIIYYLSLEIILWFLLLLFTYLVVA
jgi:hypothetical protein